MDSKSIGLCPQGFESPRCRLQGWREATENSWRLVGGCDLWAWQNFWQRLMSEGKQSSKVFRPLTHPGRESLCHMGRQHAHASTPKGFEPLRAEPNGFLVHLLSHSDTVSSAGDLHWLLRHSQSTFVHQPRRLMMSEVQPYCQFGSSGSHGFHCSRVEHIPAPPAQGATAARLTPDQKVGSSNLSGLIYSPFALSMSTHTENTKNLL